MSFSKKHANLEWNPSRDIQGVMIGDARQDGPTVAVLGGVHGDEPAGTCIVTSMPYELAVTSGRVVAIQANIPAIASGTRHSEGGVNLNRCFKPLTPDQQLRSDHPYEVQRAQELMGVIKSLGVTAFYDIHEYEDPEGTPFSICERPSLSTALKIGLPATALGFADAEPGGTDDFGYRNNIEAICGEIGSMGSEFLPGNIRYGKQIIDRFLAAHALTTETLQPLSDTSMLVQVDSESPHIRTGDTFEWARCFKSFEPLSRGELIAIDGGNEVRSSADRDEVILFPKPKAPAKGREAFELARRIEY